MNVTVHHIGPTCVQCNQTKKLFTKLGVRYDEIDLREHPELVEKFKQLGHLTAPIVTAGDIIWSGFRHSKIENLSRQIHADKAHSKQE